MAVQVYQHIQSADTKVHFDQYSRAVKAGGSPAEPQGTMAQGVVTWVREGQKPTQKGEAKNHKRQAQQQRKSTVAARKRN